MKHLLAASLLLVSVAANAKTLIVAVIDTGIDQKLPHLCQIGHKSFLPKGNPLQDSHGHGTHVAGLINRNAGSKANYCILSLQYYSDASGGYGNAKRLQDAIAYATTIGVDFINYSGGGEDSLSVEQKLLVKAMDQGITVVVAAGNDGKDLDKSCSFYPACYNDNRIVVVGSLLKDANHGCYPGDKRPRKTINYPRRAPSSNYGKKVTHWEVGIGCESDAPGGGMKEMSGTSQATAVITGKLINSRYMK